MMTGALRCGSSAGDPPYEFQQRKGSSGVKFKGVGVVYIPHTHSQPIFLKMVFLLENKKKAWKIYFLVYI